MSSKTAELVRNITPIAFASIGGFIAIASLLAPNLSGEQRATGAGVAGAAIAGGSGIARQSGDSSSESEANVNVLPAGSNPPTDTGYTYNPPSLQPSNWQQYQQTEQQYTGGHQGSYQVISPDDE